MSDTASEESGRRGGSVLTILSGPLVRLVERYLPDPYVLVLILTLIVMVAAMLVEGTTPLAAVAMWGDGFWSLLQFSMQMLLILVGGFMMASTPLVRGLLARLAARAASPGGAILMVSLVSLLASWINWGFGLVVGAFFAKELARVVRVDYRLLVASAYSGFLVWHGGLAGSIPLSIATEGHPFVDQTGVIGTGQTIFSLYNIAIVVALFVTIPLVNRAMMPAERDAVIVDPDRFEAEGEAGDAADRPAEWLETTPYLSWIVGAAGVAWLLDHFLTGGDLTLNVINFAFLMVAIVLHGTPRRLLASLREGITGAAGIVIQFPFYAGIMGLMVESGLAATVSDALISLANERTLPLWTFLSAGLVNFFVPSGGGQWAVQAPVVMPAAEALGVDQARAAMAVAWGDAWTNMIQPFWALPLLGIAGLRARDIMGYCTVHLLIGGAIIALLLTFL